MVEADQLVRPWAGHMNGSKALSTELRHSRLRIGLCVAAFYLLTWACGDGGLGAGDDCTDLLYGRADDLDLYLSTSEWSLTRHLMVVGEKGTAEALFYAGTDLIGGPDATFRSSDPSVVRVSGRELAAVRVGSATISAEGCGLTDQRSVAVSAVPLPIEALEVYRISGWPGTATNDSTGNLVLLELRVGESSALGISAIRDGGPVFGSGLLPTFASSNTAVAVGMPNCRPPEVDPSCNVFSDGWITARGVGTVEMAVTVRNITWSFRVQVTSP